MLIYWVEIKEPIVVDGTVEFQMASIRSRTKPTRNILDNLIITVKETLDGGLVSINNISETIGVEVVYDYRSYGSLTANLFIDIQETLRWWVSKYKHTIRSYKYICRHRSRW